MMRIIIIFINIYDIDNKLRDFYNILEKITDKIGNKKVISVDTNNTDKKIKIKDCLQNNKLYRQ